MDDLLTLDAEPVPSPVDGIELYRAVWARQGRGLSVATERGFIARTQPGGIAVAVSLESPFESFTYWVSYHSDTAKGAVAGLKRKLRREWPRAARSCWPGLT